MYVCDALFDNRVGWYGNFTNQLKKGGGEIPAVHVNSNGFVISGGVSISTTGVASINLFVQSSSNTSSGSTHTSTNVYLDSRIPISSTLNDRSTHTIIFTRVSNGTADGTFSGKVWNSSTPNQTVSITDGIFSNLPVL